MMAVGTAVIGSLQFGYNTGVINAPQNVSIYICVRDEGKRQEICEEMCENNDRKVGESYSNMRSQGSGRYFGTFKAFTAVYS